MLQGTYERNKSKIRSIIFKDGLKALSSIVGVDIQADNCHETRVRLLEQFIKQFPNANELTILLASGILANNIICDNTLNPKTEKLKSIIKEYEK